MNLLWNGQWHADTAFWDQGALSENCRDQPIPSGAKEYNAVERNFFRRPVASGISRASRREILTPRGGRRERPSVLDELVLWTVQQPTEEQRRLLIGRLHE